MALNMPYQYILSKIASSSLYHKSVRNSYYKKGYFAMTEINTIGKLQWKDNSIDLWTSFMIHTIIEILIPTMEYLVSNMTNSSYIEFNATQFKDFDAYSPFRFLSIRIIFGVLYSLVFLGCICGKYISVKSDADRETHKCPYVQFNWGLNLQINTQIIDRTFLPLMLQINESSGT